MIASAAADSINGNAISQAPGIGAMTVTWHEKEFSWFQFCRALGEIPSWKWNLIDRFRLNILVRVIILNQAWFGQWRCIALQCIALIQVKRLCISIIQLVFIRDEYILTRITTSTCTSTGTPYDYPSGRSAYCGWCSVISPHSSVCTVTCNYSYGTGTITYKYCYIPITRWYQNKYCLLRIGSSR